MTLVDFPVQEVLISDILPNKYNPKKPVGEDTYNQKQYENLKKALQVHGYEDKIKVRTNEDGKYEIVDGYHRRCALKDNGYNGKIQVIFLGEVSLAEAITKTISGEEIKIPLDEIEVAKLLKGLKEDNLLEESMELLPYTEEEIEVKIQILDFDFDRKPKDEDEEDLEKQGGEGKKVAVVVFVDDRTEAAELITELEGLGHTDIKMQG